jgi:branched-chain amino acid transport system substrate-binding protein
MNHTALSLLCPMLAACTFNGPRVITCETNEDCQSGFGWGNSCEAEGYCATVAANPRCETLPDDLFELREDYQDDILIGMLYNIHTSTVEYRAARLAVAQANEAAGLDGQRFAFVACTNEEMPSLDNLDAERANLEMASYLTDELGVDLLVGANTSGDSASAYTVTEPEQALMISPSATSPALTTLDGLSCTDQEPGLFWRTAPPDSLQGLVLAQDLSARGISRVAVLYEEGPYGEGLAEAVDANFDGEIGRYLVTDEASISSSAAQAAEAGYPEVVFIAGLQDWYVSFLLAASVMEEYQDIGLAFSDGGYYSTIFEDAAAASELFDQIRGTRPTVDPEAPAYVSFAASYASYYDGEAAADSAYSAHAYDAAWMAIYGAAWATYQEGAISGPGAARGLRHLSSGAEVEVRPTSWTTVVASFQAGQDVDLQGASGSLNYDPTSCETVAPIEIWSLEHSGGSWAFKSEDVIEP